MVAANLCIRPSASVCMMCRSVGYGIRVLDGSCLIEVFNGCVRLDGHSPGLLSCAGGPRAAGRPQQGPGQQGPRCGAPCDSGSTLHCCLTSSCCADACHQSASSVLPISPCAYRHRKDAGLALHPPFWLDVCVVILSLWDAHSQQFCTQHALLLLGTWKRSHCALEWLLGTKLSLALGRAKQSCWAHFSLGP